MQKEIKEGIRGCEDNAGGQKRTQKKPRTRNSPKPPCIITGAKNLNPLHTTGVFFASILAVRLGHSNRAYTVKRAAARGIRGCEDNAGGQKKMQKKPRTRNSPKPPCIITGAKNLNPLHTTGVFFASILAVRLGHSNRAYTVKRAAARGIRGCEDNAGGQKKMQKKPRMGVEPTTYGLQNRCSAS